MHCHFVLVTPGAYPLLVPGFSEPRKLLKSLLVSWLNIRDPEFLFCVLISINLAWFYFIHSFQPDPTLLGSQIYSNVINWNLQNLAILLVHLVPSHRLFCNWPPEVCQDLSLVIIIGQETMRDGEDGSWEALSPVLQARGDTDLLKQGRKAASTDKEGLAEFKGQGPNFIQMCP